MLSGKQLAPKPRAREGRVWTRAQANSYNRLVPTWDAESAFTH